MTSPGAHGEGDAVTLCRWERRLGNHHLGWSYRDVREGVTHPVDGEPDLWVALPREQHMRLLARANTAKVAADLMRAERDALRGEVATLRGARSAEDVCEMLCEASCVDVTPERCARIWSLLKHPATTMTTLAVIADERGESYAKVRALLKEARAYVAVMREAAIEEREASGIDIGRADRVTSDLLSRIDDALGEGGA